MTPQKQHYKPYIDPYEQERKRRGVEDEEYGDREANLCNFDKNF